jgi:hypothetical protein
MHNHSINQFGKTCDQMLSEFRDEMGELMHVGDLPEYVLVASFEEEEDWEKEREGKRRLR